MEIAANVISGALIGTALFVMRAAVLQIMAQNSRFGRELLKSADSLDKLKQKVKDKIRDVLQLLKNKIPEIREEIAEEMRIEKSSKRGITKATNSLEHMTAGWDTRITALEEAGILAGPYIIKPEALKFKLVEFLVESGGYTTLKAGDLPLSPKADLNRPPNPVLKIRDTITADQKSKNRTEKRLRKEIQNKLDNTVTPEPTRWSLEKVKKKKRRGGLRQMVSRAAHRDRGSQNEASPAAKPEHKPSPEKRSTRKGTT